MLGCTETVTIVHHKKGVDNDEYICTVKQDASWYKKNTISTSGDGAKPVNTYDVRILSTDDNLAELGDYVVRGIVDNITKPADLKGLDCFRITAIGDNRRGSLAHWRLSGQ